MISEIDRVPSAGDSARQLHRVRMVSARAINSLMLSSTLVLFGGGLIAVVSTSFAQDANQVFTYSAWITACSLFLAVSIESCAGVRNLIRVDLFMLFVLFLLTFLEFLFPQSSLNGRVTLEGAQSAVQATLTAFSGIYLGRLAFPVRRPLPALVELQVPVRTTMTLLIGCAFFGHLYMLLAVRFNVVEMIYELIQPRFTQPWTRGRYGSLLTLLHEFGLLVNLIPPLAATVLAKRHSFRPWQIIVALALIGLVLFEGFAGGTRNTFLIYLITFVVAYALMIPRLTFLKLSRLALPSLVVAAFAIYWLPELRTKGLSGFDFDTANTSSVFVDMNIVNIATITEVIPSKVGFLGFEVPWIAIIRPIPRGLWSGKPEGLSFSVNDAVGVGDHMTIAAAFPGELWMAGGYFAIAIFSLFAGAAAGLWNRRGTKARSTLDFTVFAIGFFPAGLMMRSFMSSAPAFLPVFAILLYLKFRSKKSSNYAKQKR